MSTDSGDITLELFDQDAPNTVANFVKLAKEGFYDGLAFHRVIDGFMARVVAPTAAKDPVACLEPVAWATRSTVKSTAKSTSPARCQWLMLAKTPVAVSSSSCMKPSPISMVFTPFSA